MLLDSVADAIFVFTKPHKDKDMVFPPSEFIKVVGRLLRIDTSDQRSVVVSQTGV